MSTGSNATSTSNIIPKTPLDLPYALLALITLGSVWGITLLFSKHIMSGPHAPPGLILWQLVIGGVMLQAYCRIIKKSLPMSRKDILFYISVALLGTIVPNSFSYIVAANLPVGLMAIGLATVPFFTLVIALLTKHERPVLTRLVGIGIGGLAMLLLLGPGTDLPDKGLTIFMLMAFVAPFCYGLEANYIGRFTPPTMDPINALRGASMVGILLCLPWVWMTDTWVDLGQPWTSIEWTLIASSIVHVLTYTGYVWMVSRAGAVFASQIAYVVTLSGIISGMVWLGERHHALVWLALVLMVMGLALVQPNPFTRADKQTK